MSFLSLLRIMPRYHMWLAALHLSLPLCASCHKTPYYHRPLLAFWHFLITIYHWSIFYFAKRSSGDAFIPSDAFPLPSWRFCVQAPICLCGFPAISNDSLRLASLLLLPGYPRVRVYDIVDHSLRPLLDSNDPSIICHGTHHLCHCHMETGFGCALFVVYVPVHPPIAA